MTRTGVLIEAREGNVKETSLGTLTAAKGHEVYAIVINEDTHTIKEQVAEYGASKLVNLKSESGDFLKSPDLLADALVKTIQQFELGVFIGTASAGGKDLFARVAAILDEPLLSDCVKIIIDEKRIKKSHFSGKTLATIESDSRVFLCTIRPNSIEAIKSTQEVEVIDFTAQAEDPGLLTVFETKKDSSDKIDLTEATIIITGGRAIKAAENYSMLEECAKILGAAVGASRAAVDAGYAPHSMQVGQTGKTVSPKLYIACGVSGAVQHFAGMKTSKIIVAINEDKDAPIFSKCDYGIVGDIFDVVPVLTEKLKEQI